MSAEIPNLGAQIGPDGELISPIESTTKLTATITQQAKDLRVAREETQGYFLNLMSELEESRKEAGNFCLTFGERENHGVIFLNPDTQDAHEVVYPVVTKIGLF